MGEPSKAKTLKNLPNELRHQIYGYCSVNARLCLKMCCREFRDGTTGTVRELYEDLNLIIDFGDAKFERLCLDDTYTGSKTKRHVCSVCRHVHRAEEFAKRELGKDPPDPRNRVCEGSQRLPDLTPSNRSTLGFSFTYQELLQLRNASVPLPSPYDEAFALRLMEDETGQWVIIMDWNFPMQSPLSRAWKDDLRHLLQNFPVCVCPHLMSSEPQLLQAIISYGDNRYADPAFVVCSTCNTKVDFDLPAGPAGRWDHGAGVPGVSFHVERRLGRLGESAVDPRWKAQSLPRPRR